MIKAPRTQEARAAQKRKSDEPSGRPGRRGFDAGPRGCRANRSEVDVVAAARSCRILGLVTTSLLATAGCDPDAVIERPTPLYGEAPIEYPLHLWDLDLEGETVLRVRVTDTGQVDSVEVTTTSGHPAFDSAAIAGAREMRFQPARRDGKRIEVWAQVPVQFSKRPRTDSLGGA
jgi:TonB family protein